MLSQPPNEAAIYGIFNESINFIVVCRSPSICIIGNLIIKNMPYDGIQYIILDKRKKKVIVLLGNHIFESQLSKFPPQN